MTLLISPASSGAGLLGSNPSDRCETTFTTVRDHFFRERLLRRRAFGVREKVGRNTSEASWCGAGEPWRIHAI